MQQQRELVAAEPGHRVAGADALAQPLGRPPTSSASPTSWPSRSLTVLEVVQVDQREASGPAGRRGQRRARPLLEQRPVGQAGEGVVGGPVAQLRLVPLELAQLASLSRSSRPFSFSAWICRATTSTVRQTAAEATVRTWARPWSATTSSSASVAATARYGTG